MRSPYSSRAVPMVAILVALVAFCASSAGAVPLSVTGIQGIAPLQLTGAALSARVANLNEGRYGLWVDLGLVRDGTPTSPVYAGFAGLSTDAPLPLLDKLPVLTRKGAGYAMPTKTAFVYLAVEF